MEHERLDTLLDLEQQVLLLLLLGRLDAGDAILIGEAVAERISVAKEEASHDA